MLRDKVTHKFVRSFLDVVVLTVLNHSSMYGYEIMKIIHKEFGVLLSPGTLYPLLHSLEKEELIESNDDKGKIYYRSNLKGLELFNKMVLDLNLTFKKISSLNLMM